MTELVGLGLSVVECRDLKHGKQTLLQRGSIQTHNNAVQNQ